MTRQQLSFDVPQFVADTMEKEERPVVVRRDSEPHDLVRSNTLPASIAIALCAAGIPNMLCAAPWQAVFDQPLAN
jgi:hypothetical protein